MQFLISIISRFGFFFLFLILEVISLLLILQNNNFHKSVAGEWNTAITGVFYDYSSRFNSFVQAPDEVDRLQQENRMLREKLLLSQNRPIKVKPVVKFDTINASKLNQYQIIPARIINNSISRKQNYITLDKGKADGVRKDMGIISSKGIVGVVVNTSDHYSRVSSILNSNQPLNARIKGLDYFGTLKWNNQTNNPKSFKLTEIPKYVEAKVGDTIETDGKSHIFPEGIIVGKIKKVGIDVENGYLDLDVQIMEDFANLTQAYIIKNLKKKELDELENLDNPTSENE